MRKCIFISVLVLSIINFQKDCFIVNIPSTKDVIQHFVDKSEIMASIITQVVNITQCIIFINHSGTMWGLLLSSKMVGLNFIKRSNGLVVKALDSQSSGLVFKTTGWLQV